ncbi:MAG: glutamate 5-kinase [Alphaproteobacteria bacterium]|nr:glutamate 5-kinase [Alphaproteobacteria bacterium]
MDRLDKPIILLKLGTATLTQGGDKISRAKLEDIANQVIVLRKNYYIILVCSGAIAAAKQFIKLEHLGNEIKEKQALAAIGQPFLMRLISESFRDFKISIGQCLLSNYDFENSHSKDNIFNTISVLLKNNILPVINENDTTATEEIKFGDNDKLSALVACLFKVNKLILASNTYGVYDDSMNTIETIYNLNDAKKYILLEKSSQGTGGMQSKLDAAKIALKENIETWIINGHDTNFLLNVFDGRSKYTKILRK